MSKLETLASWLLFLTSAALYVFSVFLYESGLNYSGTSVVAAIMVMFVGVGFTMWRQIEAEKREKR